MPKPKSNTLTQEQIDLLLGKDPKQAPPPSPLKPEEYDPELDPQVEHLWTADPPWKGRRMAIDEPYWPPLDLPAGRFASPMMSNRLLGGTADPEDHRRVLSVALHTESDLLRTIAVKQLIAIDEWCAPFSPDTRTQIYQMAERCGIESKISWRSAEAK
jgi:hypothetical protein